MGSETEWFRDNQLPAIDAEPISLYTTFIAPSTPNYNILWKEPKKISNSGR